MKRPAGVSALTAFFAFGATMSGLAAFSLAFPLSLLERLWRINPEGRAGLGSLGWAGVGLMAAVSLACFEAAWGLWLGKSWGRRLAIAILVVNTSADLANTIVAGDRRTLIGLPIAGAMLFYLFRSVRVRGFFAARAR